MVGYCLNLRLIFRRLAVVQQLPLRIFFVVESLETAKSLDSATKQSLSKRWCVAAPETSAQTATLLLMVVTINVRAKRRVK